MGPAPSYCYTVATTIFGLGCARSFSKPVGSPLPHHRPQPPGGHYRHSSSSPILPDPSSPPHRAAQISSSSSSSSPQCPGSSAPLRFLLLLFAPFRSDKPNRASVQLRCAAARLHLQARQRRSSSPSRNVLFSSLLPIHLHSVPSASPALPPPRISPFTERAVCQPGGAPRPSTSSVAPTSVCLRLPRRLATSVVEANSVDDKHLASGASDRMKRRAIRISRTVAQGEYIIVRAHVQYVNPISQFHGATSDNFLSSPTPIPFPSLPSSTTSHASSLQSTANAAATPASTASPHPSSLHPPQASIPTSATGLPCAMSISPHLARNLYNKHSLYQGNRAVVVARFEAAI
ncbi:hypothetical protein EJB05_09649, partial [Eragrostis curvula]